MICRLLSTACAAAADDDDDEELLAWGSLVIALRSVDNDGGIMSENERVY
jgi:hypothetical protein